ncbi:hypothetical protein [Pseudomonas sp. DP16D-R1]|jgi:hypothetical protein|nr:hypothetical protein [Pseudomonas sp. DP16D-R1]
MPSFNDPIIDTRLDSSPSTATRHPISPGLCNEAGLIPRAVNPQ